MSIVKGQNLRLKINNKFVAFAQDCELNVETETEETSTKDSNAKFKDYDVTGVGYTVSTNALFSVDESETDTTGMDGMAALDIALTGNRLDFEFEKTDPSSDKNRTLATSPVVKYTGTVIINNFSIKATNKQNGSYTLNALGCGPLVKSSTSGTPGN